MILSYIVFMYAVLASISFTLAVNEINAAFQFISSEAFLNSSSIFRSLLELDARRDFYIKWFVYPIPMVRKIKSFFQYVYSMWVSVLLRS